MSINIVSGVSREFLKVFCWFSDICRITSPRLTGTVVWTSRSFSVLKSHWINYQRTKPLCHSETGGVTCPRNHSWQGVGRGCHGCGGSQSVVMTRSRLPPDPSTTVMVTGTTPIGTTTRSKPWRHSISCDDNSCRKFSWEIIKHITNIISGPVSGVLEYKTSIKYLSSSQETRNKSKENWEDRLTRHQNEEVIPCYWNKQSLVYQISLSCC